MVIRRPATGDYQNRAPAVEEMVLMEGKQGQQAKIILLKAGAGAEAATDADGVVAAGVTGT